MKNSYIIAWILTTALLAWCWEKSETKTVETTTSSFSSSSSIATVGQTFEINQDYSTPENWSETLKWKLVVENWTVTSIDIEKNWHTREAREYIWNFSNSIASQVVWKPLKDLQIGKVWGASLSSLAFNEALKWIES